MIPIVNDDAVKDMSIKFTVAFHPADDFTDRFFRIIRYDIPTITQSFPAIRTVDPFRPFRDLIIVFTASP